MGKAVVSTTIGAEGLPIAGGEHLLLADDPASFARAVVGLLRDSGRRSQLEAAARALVVARYDWSAVAGALEQALTRVAQLAGDKADLRLQTRHHAVPSAINLQSEISNLKSQGDAL
jgi:hypothetical protein